MSIESTLAERGSRYGDFTDHAKIAQAIQDDMRIGAGWSRLDDVKRQALTVIADKIARILSGDPSYADNWHDIQGYAKLVEDRLPAHNVDPADVEISEQPGKCKGCSAGCRDCCPGFAKLQDEKLARIRAVSAERFINEVYDRIVEPASAIDDDSERMQAIGQNGNDGEHYSDPWTDAPGWAKYASCRSGKWVYYEFRPAFTETVSRN